MSKIQDPGFKILDKCDIVIISKEELLFKWNHFEDCM